GQFKAFKGEPADGPLVDINLAIEEDVLKSFILATAESLKILSSFLNRVFRVESPLTTLKTGVSLLVLSQLGKWLRGECLLLTTMIIAFSVPKIYELQKEKIDQVLGMVATIITQKYKEI